MQPPVVVVQIMSAQHVSFSHRFPVEQLDQNIIICLDSQLHYVDPDPNYVDPNYTDPDPNYIDPDPNYNADFL